MRARGTRIDPSECHVLSEGEQEDGGCEEHQTDDDDDRDDRAADVDVHVERDTLAVVARRSRRRGRGDAPRRRVRAPGRLPRAGQGRRPGDDDRSDRLVGLERIRGPPPAHLGRLGGGRARPRHLHGPARATTRRAGGRLGGEGRRPAARGLTRDGIDLKRGHLPRGVGAADRALGVSTLHPRNEHLSGDPERVHASGADGEGASRQRRDRIGLGRAHTGLRGRRLRRRQLGGGLARRRERAGRRGGGVDVHLGRRDLCFARCTPRREPQPALHLRAALEARVEVLFEIRNASARSRVRGRPALRFLSRLALLLVALGRHAAKG